MSIRVKRLPLLAPVDLAEILAESETEGFHCLRRLVTEWDSGANRFQRPGEALFVARDGDRIVGVCGLNVDPYAGSHVGRVRHLYVLAEYRRRGVGRMLVGAVVEQAIPSFALFHLRTNIDDAVRLYQAIGFRPVEKKSVCTHALDLALLHRRPPHADGVVVPDRGCASAVKRVAGTADAPARAG
jgi:ribosomal protein S18 acetylase RimI-like enzyme